MDKSKLQNYSDKLWQVHIAVSGFYNEYAKLAGITLAELKVLGILKKEENPTQKKITQLTYLPKQTVNAIIKSFQKKNYIEIIESKADKRSKVISYTEEGKIFADNIISKAKEVEFNALNSIGEDRIKALLEAITMYKDNLRIE